jgi:chromosomal replication initiator protein
VVNGLFAIPLSGTTAVGARAADAPPRLSEFVAGPENSLAGAALAPLIDRAETICNPLVIYGPHGSGKSHLACGLADWWRGRYPDAAVVCLAGSEFAQQYVAALADDRLDAWRAALAAAHLFVLDDLGELTDKRSTQQELLRLLDALDETGALVVVTARTLPSHWPALAAALRSRLSAGLALPLALPARATRREILARLAAAHGVPLSARVLDSLAGQLAGGVPTLAAAILELQLAAITENRAVDAARVRQLLSGRAAAPKHTVREIAVLSAKYFGLKLADLKSPGRQRSLVAARGVAMYLARRSTSESLEQIGEFFGGRDHTTVLHACRRTEKLLRRDAATRQAVAELKKILASAPA